MDKQSSKFRWVVFATVMFTYLLMSSQRTAPGLITDQVMRDFSVSASTIGLVTSMQFLVYTGLQIPMGMLADRYGPNFNLIIGAALAGVGTLIYSVGTHEFVLFFSRVLTGIGDATVWVNIVLILGQWFKPKEFVRYIGVAAMTGNLGFLMATVPFSALIVLFGWRGSFFTLGILLSVCSILLYVVLEKKPKQLGLNESANKIKREKTTVLLRKILSSRQAWALFLCHFGVIGGYVGFISSWAVPYGMDVYGVSRLEASQFIMISLTGALFGSLLIGWISSRFGSMKRPYVFFHIVMLSCWFSFLLFRGQPPFYLLVVIFFIIGFAFGAGPLTFAIVRQTFPVAESGMVSGFANTGGFLSAVLLPSIFGAILDYTQASAGSVSAGYYVGFITPVVFSAIGLIGVLMVKEKGQSVSRSTEISLS